MKQLLILLACLAVGSAPAEVRVYVTQAGGKAWINYECTAGETVRAFALDVTVDAGQILNISDYFRGPCTDTAQGYGIFPASFRDHFAGAQATNIDWNLSGYSPLGDPPDNPAGTLPGLNSSGVTLEFGGLWDPNDPAAVPPPAGTLCALGISKQATVSVTTNAPRGGVLSTQPDLLLATAFENALIQPPEITGLTVSEGMIFISFAGGELETAPTTSGPWTGTGQSDGEYSENASALMRFYRVRAQ